MSGRVFFLSECHETAAAADMKLERFLCLRSDARETALRVFYMKKIEPKSVVNSCDIHTRQSHAKTALCKFKCVTNCSNVLLYLST